MTVFRRTFSITRWRTWDDQVDAAARAFKTEFGHFPFVLVASFATLAQIDLAAKKQRLIDAAGRRPGEHEHAPVSSFAGEGHVLEFCLDETLATRAFSLIFDDEPGDGEPMPTEDTVVAGGAGLRRRA